jgi:hypothetical protein
MKFGHFDLGQLDQGRVVNVALSGTEANVLLLDDSNFRSYRTGGRHSYYGGHVTRSPVQLQVPRAGHWHVAVDLGGYSGRVDAEVTVL